MRKLGLIIAILSIAKLAFATPSVSIVPGELVVSGQTKVTAANTATVLGVSTNIISVKITPLPSNIRQWILVGDSSVTVTTGDYVVSGSSVVLDVNNLTDIYIIAEVAGEGVSYIGLKSQ